MRDPVWVYDNWSAYFEGEQVENPTRLTEELAMRQLEEVVRLKRLGVRFDYYMMNAFWFAPDGAYREWRKPDWPNGPNRWIAACYENGLKPGLWFGANSMFKMNVAPQWRDSLAAKSSSQWSKYFDSLSLSEGPFLSDLMNVLQLWYERGIRMFEFDMVSFTAATDRALEAHSPEEIQARNQRALADALKAFRRTNPDVMLVAFNGFGGDIESTATPFPFKKPIDLRWLEVFDTLYSGDTRASDVPQASLWRSVDLYNDHMVRRYEQSGVPLERIDPFFTLSTTQFGYYRHKKAWKSMLMLALARGSWKQTIYGRLDLLNDEEARWFAKAQRMYAPLISMGRTKTFGGIPGEVHTYGFASADAGGALYTVVNPTQQTQVIELPLLSAVQTSLSAGRILFRDAGFAPTLDGAHISLGAGQMAVVGYGRYTDPQYDLGVEQDIVIPRDIRPAEARFKVIDDKTIEASVTPPSDGDIRIFFQQHAADGTILKDYHWRSRLEARQSGKLVPVQAEAEADGRSFNGLSWGGGEIRRADLKGNRPVTVRYSVDGDKLVQLQGRVYFVRY